jgi:hypothetical protein
LELKRKDRPRLVLKIVKQHKIEVEVEVKFIMVMKGKERVGECQPELYKDSPGFGLVEDSFAAHDHFHMRFASVKAQARTV